MQIVHRSQQIDKKMSKKRNVFYLAKKAFKKSERFSRRLIFSKKRINELISHDDEIVQKMGRVIEKSLAGALTKEEQMIVDKIEKRRSFYNRSSLNIHSSNEKKDMRKDNVSYLLSTVSKKKSWLIFQLSLIREFKIKRGLEFGTCLGISAAYQAEAIKLNGGDKLVTMEGLEPRYEFSMKLFDELEIDKIDARHGDFNELLPVVLNENSIFDYVFLDGDHRYESTIAYFEQVLPHLQENSILILDDIRWSEEMEKAWEEIRVHEQIMYTFDLELVGVCIIGKKKRKEHFKIALW